MLFSLPRPPSEWNCETSLKLTLKSLWAALVMPGTVLINEVKFRPFMGNSDISVLSTTYALSIVLVVTTGVESDSTETASERLPTTSLICLRPTWC